MIPILYEKTETEFTSNGLCRLRDATSALVTEERNGIYECDFDYPVDGANYEQIQLGRIIAVEHDDTNDVQPFDIVSYSKPINGVVSFHAVHISYRQSKIVASGQNVTSLDGAFQMLSSGLPENPFTYWTDQESTAAFPLADNVPRSVREYLGGTQGSILDTYGGEYEWDKFTVKLWDSRGTDVDFVIRYGVNMTEYDDDTDSSESYSAIVPYWIGQNGETQTVVKGGVVTNGSSTVTGRVDCVAIDYSQEFETQPTVTELENIAQATLTTKQPNLASQTIKVGFIRLQDSGEYGQFTNLLKCKLCDMIRVEFPKYGMSGRFKIVKTVYDVLLERFTEMELGTLSTTLSEALGIGSGSSSSYSTSGGGASYRLTKSGDVITLTGSDGSSSSVTDSDTTYGLSISGQSLSLVEGGSSSSVNIPSTSVSVTQKTTSGTNIADVTVNGTTTQLFAPSGGGGGDHEELTQAEYDALSQSEKENGTVYFITDSTPSFTLPFKVYDAGVLPFVFSNSQTARYAVNTAGDGVVTTDNVKMVICSGIGGAFAFGLDTYKNNIVATNSAVFTGTVNVQVLMLYE